MQGLNWYVYCNNNPMRYVDPSGKAWTEAMWWLCAVDGPVPVGDAIYVVGIIVEGAIIGSIILAQGDSRLTDNTPAKTQTETAPAPPPTPPPTPGPGKELAKAGKDIAKAEITRRLFEETKKMFDTPEDGGDNKTTDGVGKTSHGTQRANERGFSDQQIKNVKENYSHKGYQPGGRTIYVKKNGNFYDVVVTNKNGDVITTVGGNSQSLRTMKDVIKMTENNGGWYSLPID